MNIFPHRLKPNIDTLHVSLVSGAMEAIISIGMAGLSPHDLAALGRIVHRIVHLSGVPIVGIRTTAGFGLSAATARCHRQWAMKAKSSYRRVIIQPPSHPCRLPRSRRVIARRADAASNRGRHDIDRRRSRRDVQRGQHHANSCSCRIMQNMVSSAAVNIVMSACLCGAAILLMAFRYAGSLWSRRRGFVADRAGRAHARNGKRAADIARGLTRVRADCRLFIGR